MALMVMSAEDLITGLNQHFSEEHIRDTARAAAKLPVGAGMSRLAEVLGIIPKGDIKNWRADNARMPVLIDSALMVGIRNHLKTIARGSRSKSDAPSPRPIVFKLVHANHWELNIIERTTQNEITLTVRR